MKNLFKKQVSLLGGIHYYLLYWITIAEDRKVHYNLTNAFDDLKQNKITRTKQSAIAFISTLRALCFVEIREKSNRKNLYITNYGAQALQQLVQENKFNSLKSNYLEEF